jgi:hypothetical protein
LHDLLFIEGQPESFFTVMYVAMLIIVVQGLVMYPPRLFPNRKSGGDAAAVPAAPQPA